MCKKTFTFLIHLDPPERAIPGGEYHQEEPHEPEESQHAIPGGKDESQLLSEGNFTSVIFEEKKKNYPFSYLKKEK